MDIVKILTPSGIEVLKYFMDKTEYHFVSITMVTNATNKCYPSIQIALNNLTEAGILNRQPTGKMILYMRNPHSSFLTTFRELTEMIKDA